MRKSPDFVVFEGRKVKASGFREKGLAHLWHEFEHVTFAYCVAAIPTLEIWMNQRKEKLTQFAVASPVRSKGEHDLDRHPILIVSSRNAQFIRRLRSEFREQGILSDLQIANDEAGVYALPEHSGNAFKILSEVQAIHQNWRGKKSKQRKQMRITQVCITVSLIVGAIVVPIVARLFDAGAASLFRSPLFGVAILASWLVLLIVGEHLYQKGKWEGVFTFSIREMLFASTLFACVLVLWRFAVQ